MRCIYKTILHLTFDLDLWVKVTQYIAQYPLHHVTYAPANFEGVMSSGLHLQDNTLFNLGVKVTQNIFQYPLYYVNYSPVKLDLTWFNG